MKSFSVAEIGEWIDCDDNWEFSDFEEFLSTSSRFTAFDMLLTSKLYYTEKLWLVLREDVLTADQLRGLACDFAERAIPVWTSKGLDPDILAECIGITRCWIANMNCWNAKNVAAARVNRIYDALVKVKGPAWYGPFDGAMSAARACVIAANGNPAYCAADTSNRSVSAASQISGSEAIEYAWQINRVAAVIARNAI